MRIAVKVREATVTSLVTADLPANPPAKNSSKRTLIIVTGDLTDVDGFMELAYYAKYTNADVIFVQNYPNYVDPAVKGTYGQATDPYVLTNGLGYKYSVEEMDAERGKAQDKVLPLFEPWYKGYNVGGNSAGEKTKAALTDLAFKIVNKVWREVQGNENRGDIFFCIGGVHSINPFAPTFIKNELNYYYAQKVGKVESHDGLQASMLGSSFDIVEGTIHAADTMLKANGFLANSGNNVSNFPFDKYSDIYMSFTGAASFWDGQWEAALDRVKGKIRGLFVMGGVLSDHQPGTMSAMAKQLNRFSFATMNQLYHPENTKKVFDFFKTARLPIFMVTNNVSGKPMDYPGLVGSLNFDKSVAVKAALAALGLSGTFLDQASRIFYSENPAKLFDLFVGIALAYAVSQGGDAGLSKLKYRPATLFFDTKYGSTIVSGPGRTLRHALGELKAMVQSKADDVKFVRKAFKKEAIVLSSYLEDPKIGAGVKPDEEDHVEDYNKFEALNPKPKFEKVEGGVFELMFSIGGKDQEVYENDHLRSTAASGTAPGEFRDVPLQNPRPEPVLTELQYASVNGNMKTVERILGTFTGMKNLLDMVINHQNTKKTPQDQTLRAETALMMAASAGRLKVVKMLIEKNADVNKTSTEGEDALIMALDSGLGNKYEIAQLLLEANADVNKSGKTALMYFAGSYDETLFQWLLSKGADVNAADPAGMTALMYAAGANASNALEWLLSNGADANAVDSEDKTALMYAADKGHLKVVQTLLGKMTPGAIKQRSKHPNTKAPGDGSTASEMAQANGYMNVVAAIPGSHQYI